MANLTVDRKSSPYLSFVTQPYFGPFGLAANQVIYAGCMYALGTDGRPINPGATNVVVAGVATQHYSNTAGAPYYKSGATDGVKIELFSGIFGMDAHATHPPTAADLWGPAFASSNHEISRLGSDGSYAGVIVGVEGSTIYVWISPFGTQKALSGLAPLTENAGAIGGTNDGNLPDLTPTAVTVAAAAAATAGGATPTAAQVDTGIATAIAPLVIAHNALLADVAANRAAIRELAARLNAVL